MNRKIFTFIILLTFSLQFIPFVQAEELGEPQDWSIESGTGHSIEHKNGKERQVINKMGIDTRCEDGKAVERVETEQSSVTDFDGTQTEFVQAKRTIPQGYQSEGETRIFKGEPTWWDKLFNKGQPKPDQVHRSEGSGSSDLDVSSDECKKAEGKKQPEASKLKAKVKGWRGSIAFQGQGQWQMNLNRQMDVSNGLIEGGSEGSAISSGTSQENGTELVELNFVLQEDPDESTGKKRIYTVKEGSLNYHVSGQRSGGGKGEVKGSKASLGGSRYSNENWGGSGSVQLEPDSVKLSIDLENGWYVLKIMSPPYPVDYHRTEQWGAVTLQVAGTSPITWGEPGSKSESGKNENHVNFEYVDRWNPRREIKGEKRWSSEEIKQRYEESVNNSMELANDAMPMAQAMQNAMSPDGNVDIGKLMQMSSQLEGPTKQLEQKSYEMKHRNPMPPSVYCPIMPPEVGSSSGTVRAEWTLTAVEQ